MKNKRRSIYVIAIMLIAVFFVVWNRSTATEMADAGNDEQTSIPKVFFTTDISPEGLMAVYQALGVEPSGKVAVKIHTGEPGNTHYLKPELIGDLVKSVNGTFVETNVAYPSRRGNAEEHYKVAEEHGFVAVAPVVIMDETADISLPVTNGKHLTENLVGSRITEFDFHIVLSHFKGHQMGGFGGALKNLSIGYGSAAGKALIHSHGRSRSDMWGGDQNSFLEAMAEAAKTITDHANGNILYINVLNHMSVDCDCNGNPTAPSMADIGIVASLDPVAIDQASVDLATASEDSADLIERIASRNGMLTLEHAESLGIGSRQYELVKINP